MSELSALDKKGLEAVKKNELEAAVASLPLPGPALEAFANGPIQVGQYSVRKVVKYDWRVWQQTKNAIVLNINQFALPKEQQRMIEDNESDTVAIWMLIHAPMEVEEALKEGADKFKARCVHDLELDMELWQHNALFEAVMRQVVASCATALRHSVKDDKEGATTFFQETGASPRTG